MSNTYFSYWRIKFLVGIQILNFNRDRAGGGGNEAGTKSASPEETSHKKEKLMVNDSSCELLADYYCCPVLLLGQENRFGPGPKYFDLAQIILD